MAKNKVFDGDVVTIEKASVESGDIVVENYLKGVALTDSDSDDKVQVANKGVWEIKVKAHDGSSDSKVEVGDKLYFDSSEDRLDKNDSGTFFGIALEEVSEGEEEDAQVMIVQG